MSYMSFEKAQRQVAEREEKRNPPALNMSLRDHLAALAMQGILAGNHQITREPEPLPIIANAAYALADAMIKTRGVE